MRECGVLMPIFSIPSKYGIGCFSAEAYHFVDQMKAAGIRKWQILPLGPTGYGDSPYQSFSTFAGNPYFIDLEVLRNDGLLEQWELDQADWGWDETRVDYGKMYNTRNPMLRKAFSRFHESDDYRAYVRTNTGWIEDYALYMAVKNDQGGKCWIDWPKDLKMRDPKALKEATEKLDEEIRFYYFQQYQFDRQWTWLHTYANRQGIEIVGDIPIYVSIDSSDAWSHPDLFMFDEDCKPTDVAGCPPDAFCATGQLWGNPLYDWKKHQRTGYEWWIRRIEKSLKLYDVVRLDHFRGFDEFYAVPYGDPTAEFGKWLPGPGMDFFDALKDYFGKLPFIAEDLGYLTPTVIKLLKDTKLPGMKVLQFAFDTREPSNYMPYTYDRNCVVYTGTHDNNTTRGWFMEASDNTKQICKEYFHREWFDENKVAWDFIAIAMQSVADLCVIPVQDFLNLDGNGRINMPSSVGSNWSWRMRNGAINDWVVNEIRTLVKITGR